MGVAGVMKNARSGVRFGRSLNLGINHHIA